MTNSDDINLRVSREVKSWIARRGILKSDAAALIGANPSGMTRRLAGQTPFALDELEILAAAFGVRLAVLIGEPPTVTELRANPTNPTPPEHAPARKRRGSRSTAYKCTASRRLRNRPRSTSYLSPHLLTRGEGGHTRRAA